MKKHLLHSHTKCANAMEVFLFEDKSSLLIRSKVERDSDEETGFQIVNKIDTEYHFHL